jgi:predicted enzyme related to lactoylglutathione lyase
VAVEVGKLEICIVVKDLEAVTPFYRDGLGLTHVGDLRTKLGLNRRFKWHDDVIVVMQLDEPPTIGHPPGGTGGGATGFRFLVLRDDVNELEDVLERCIAAGGKPDRPIMDMGDWRLLIVSDPEDTCRIEVTTRVKSA